MLDNLCACLSLYYVQKYFRIVMFRVFIMFDHTIINSAETLYTKKCVKNVTSKLESFQSKTYLYQSISS